MNADGFRDFYAYHFAANRKIWETCIAPLPDALFLQDDTYGVGSVRNHVVHLMNIDDRWFSGLRGLSLPPFATYSDWTDRAVIRSAWDVVEANMREYLAGVTDETLMSKPLPDTDITVWQVLLHVANHGTDHRAQLLRQLAALGVETFPQDYIFFAWGRL